MRQTLLSNHWETLVPIDNYATAADFQRFFARNMTPMFRLAFLLTADPDVAERCLIRAMRKCLSAEHIFKRWVAVWARRSVVRNAIELVDGFQENSAANSLSEAELVTTHDPLRGVTEEFTDSAAIFTLGNFERLVFVLCITEGYPIADCALLLGRSPREVHKAQRRAVAQVAALEQEWRGVSANAAAESPNLTVAGDQYEVDCSCGSLLL